MRSILCAVALSACLAPQVRAADGETFYVNPETGADTNPGTKEKPFKTLPGASDRVNELKGEGAVTVILAPGNYALDRQFSLKPIRKYTKTDRLTIRAEVLPDDEKWNTGKMPTLIHTMPLARRGFTFGMLVETSHVTLQGLKVLGMPGVETPTPGALNRVYPIGRMDKTLDDLEIAQCVFAGDKVTNPNHACVLALGNGINVHHCVFYGCKMTVVYWSPGSTGHSMTNCFVTGSYATGIWTTENAADFVFRNNVIANGNYVWTYQSGALAPRDPDLFAGNKKLACSGTGAYLGFKDIDSSFLELENTKVTDDKVEVEMDESKKNYLHPVAGSSAEKIGVGLFMKRVK
jgi:hypothetical protein